MNFRNTFCSGSVPALNPAPSKLLRVSDAVEPVGFGLAAAPKIEPHNGDDIGQARHQANRGEDEAVKSHDQSANWPGQNDNAS